MFVDSRDFPVNTCRRNSSDSAVTWRLLSIQVRSMKMKLTPIPREILNDLQYNLIDVKLLQRNVLDRSDFILLSTYITNDEKVEILMELMRKKTEEDHDNFLEIMDEDYRWLRDKCEIYFQKIRLDNLLNGNQVHSKPSLPSTEGVSTTKESTSIEENDRSTPPECRTWSNIDSIAAPAISIKDEFILHHQKNTNILSEEKSMRLNQTITAQMMTIVKRNHRVVRKWTTLAHILGMTYIVHTLRMRMVMNGEDLDACVLHLLEEWKGAYPKEASLGKLITALREECFNDVADELEQKFMV